MSDLARQQCYNHPGREAIVRCPSCLHDYCRECVTEHDDRYLCSACLRLQAGKDARAPRRVRVPVGVLMAVAGLLSAWVVYYASAQYLVLRKRSRSIVSRMARTLTAPSPLDTLEEAFDLLQRAPASVWLGYLAGSGPLIVGLLFVLNEFTGADAASHNPVIAALLLVVLLVWFYRCRQIFSGHLRRSLSLGAGVAGPPISPALACFEGTRLIAIPLAIVSLLLMAYVVAFYRSLTVFAAEGLSARDAAAKAWKACIAWQRENWFTLAILNLFGLAVLIDVALTVIVAPMLVKLFTGYESIFTQRGAAALGSQFPIIIALTWLSLDPLLQAIYVVRSFHWEGLRSGEDLLVRLRRMAPLLAILCVTGVSLSAAPQPPTLVRDDLNRSIDQTLQSHDYNWRIPPGATEDEKHDWFIDTVDRAVEYLRKSWKAVSDLWSDLLDWIDRMLRSALPSLDRAQSGKPTVVRPVFYLIGVAIVVLALVLLWKLGPRRKTVVAPQAAPRTVDIHNEGVLASDLPEDEWLKMAEGYASAGDLRLALRALYLGTLALLNGRGLVTIHACKSNRDYEGELGRRSRDTGLTQIFHVNIRSFEQSWYGFHEVTGEQLRSFRDNLGRMRSNAA